MKQRLPGKSDWLLMFIILPKKQDNTISVHALYHINKITKWPQYAVKNVIVRI